MREVTLGISPCPNDVFLFSGILLDRIDLEEQRFRVDFQDIETLNRRAQEGELDVAKMSYANYIRCESRYSLLSCGGALGRGVGPLLLSRDGSWNPEREILVPGENTTANFLLDYYAQRPLRKRYLPFDALYAELCSVPGTQGVVIHEKRFTYERDGLRLIQDLGSYWEERTGYAIPLGAIVVRRDLALEMPISNLIRRSLRWANDHYADAFALCRSYAQDLSEGVIEAHIALYVNHYSENLGPEGEAAVAYFLAQQRKFIGIRD